VAAKETAEGREPDRTPTDEQILSAVSGVALMRRRRDDAQVVAGKASDALKDAEMGLFAAERNLSHLMACIGDDL
jgi:hypothetical protein